MRADDILDYFKQEKVHVLLRKLKDAGVNMISSAGEIKDTRLSDKTFVVTGTLPTLKREEGQQNLLNASVVRLAVRLVKERRTSWLAKTLEAN